MDPHNHSQSSSSPPTVTNRPLAVLVLIAVAIWLIRSQGGCEGAGVEQSVRPGINAEFLSGTDVSKWVERFEGESREIFRHRMRIVDDADILTGQSIADVGAGTGLFTFLFAQAVGPSGTVYAVDISEEFTTLIRERAKELGLTHVVTVRNSQRSVDLPAESVDVVFICDTYHHFEYPESTLASIHKALRPGGQLLVIDFKRIEDVSRAWVLEHVRAGQEVFSDEIIAAGFEPDESPDAEYLEENYYLRFRKPHEK
ncbi:MAG: SAM-dependent methyltransferase [Planctomycetota bacterium]|nr:MAG: SAM-dependent methyltransferase [Planctomycetota bacterium]